MHLRKSLLAFALLACFSQYLVGEEAEKEVKPTIESPSPNGQFAFRYTPETEETGKAYDLIRTQTGEALARVAESDDDPAPSARFDMKVLWRPDSKAFALTATLTKRGSSVTVYVQEGTTFREIELPELLAEIPEKVKRGKEYPHVVQLNSQSAKRWQKDGSLVVEIDNIQDGTDGSITAHRTVVLGFTPSGKAKILKSNIKFTTETP